MFIPPITTPPLPPMPDLSPVAGNGAAPSFAQELSGAVHHMEAMQQSAVHQVNQLVAGKSEDVHSSMIAVEKADLAFGLMLQLRNKAVQAYQDISHMNF